MLEWLGTVRRLFAGDRVDSPSQTNVGSGHAVQAGRDALVAGGNITVVAPDPLDGVPWPRHRDGPTFRISPGVQNHPPHWKEVTLLFSFEVLAGSAKGFRGAWILNGTGSHEVAVMRENRPGKYQIKGFQFAPDVAASEVTLRLEFDWVDGKVHAAWWTWPLVKREPKGHWELGNTRENTETPAGWE